MARLLVIITVRNLKVRNSKPLDNISIQLVLFLIEVNQFTFKLICFPFFLMYEKVTTTTPTKVVFFFVVFFPIPFQSVMNVYY